jgi:ABC-type multidrug transport system fused ATPase/permease subunit
MKQIRWILKTIRPFWMQVTAMMLCHIAVAACAIAFVYVSKVMVDNATAMFAAQAAGAAETVGTIWTNLGKWACAMIGIVVFRILLNSLRSYIQTKTDVKLRNRLRSRMFDQLLNTRHENSASLHTGDLVNRVFEDVRVVASAVSVSLPNTIGSCIQFAAALIFLLILDLRLAIVIAVILPVGIIGGKYITYRLRSLTHNIRNSDSKVQVHIQESIQHKTVIQTMDYVDNSSSELIDLQSDLYGNELKRVRFSIAARIIMALCMSGGHAIVFLWGVFGISTGAVTYGMMTAFLQLVSQLQRPLLEMSSSVPSLIHAIASVDRIIEIEEIPRDKADEARHLAGVPGIKIENVTYAYPESDTEIFTDFSHNFLPGSRTAIVGPTGIGKSTLIRLLLALLTPKKGSITIYDNEEIPISASTRCNLVYVPQGNSLFSGTIRENLQMGDPQATDEKMWWALETSAADFVKELPSGLDSPCFEAGVGLSEGQAQRVAIARALLRPGKVLLLDEFSSALDTQTEDILMERLTKALPDRTMIFITHRERIIEFCDSVLRLSKN